MTLLILNLDHHPKICDEVVWQTQEYRQRPLAGPIFPPHPEDGRNADVHINTGKVGLGKLLTSLPQAVCGGANPIFSAFHDWTARTKAVFHSTDSSWMRSCTFTSTCSPAMVAKIYSQVLDELVQDVTQLKDEAYSTCWPEEMSEEERDIIRSGTRLCICAIFVGPFVSCGWMTLCARRT